MKSFRFLIGALAIATAPFTAGAEPPVWKAMLALRMKTETDVANAWLAEKLGMGPPSMSAKQGGQAGYAQFQKTGFRMCR